MMSSSTCQIELHANLEWDSFGQWLRSRLASTYTSKCFAISNVSWWSISINMVTCTWIQVTMTYVQVGSSEEQKDLWLGEAPPVLHWAMGGDARQCGENNKPHTNREFRRYQAWYQRSTRCGLRLQWTEADYADIESSDDEDTAYDQSTHAGRQVEAGPILDRVVSQSTYYVTFSYIRKQN